ncbi:hypothetical protein AB0O20_37040 [Streptomyces kronopolitis]|uniref:hypothetical protein n=1 Tax=Streptomyces kronopolitis TaxID=1612435 RepID=UPI003433F6D1
MPRSNSLSGSMDASARATSTTWHRPRAARCAKCVHFGTADQIRDQRAAALAEAFERHPERFARRPRPPEIPAKAWINDPARHSQPEPQAP